MTLIDAALKKIEEGFDDDPSQDDVTRIWVAVYGWEPMAGDAPEVERIRRVAARIRREERERCLRVIRDAREIGSADLREVAARIQALDGQSTPEGEKTR